MKRSFLFLAAALILTGAGAASADEAKVMAVTGEAFIAGADGIMRAKPGMSCAAGDMVMTRPGAVVDLVLNGQAGCRLLPDTTAAVAGMKDGNIRVLVAEGNIVLNVKKMPEGTRFLVDTPTSVAAVRGTQFWGRVAGNEGTAVTTFAVKEGGIRVRSKETGAEADLNAGQAVDLGPGQTGLSPRPATAAELDAMKAADELAERM